MFGKHVCGNENVSRSSLLMMQPPQNGMLIMLVSALVLLGITSKPNSLV